MKKSFKIIIGLLLCVMVTGCGSDKTEFEKKYQIDNHDIQDMTYAELLTFVKDQSGVIFIGKKDPETKDLAEVFCDNLCECDVNKAHYVNSDKINDDKLLTIFKVEKLEFPIIVAYKNGELVAYYDKATNPADIDNYIYDLIRSVYPAGVCTETC